MRRDLGAEWLQILMTWPIVFGVGVGIIFAWRAWQVSRGTRKDKLASPTAVLMFWGVGAFLIAGYPVSGPLPMDDYPYRR